MSYRPKQYYVEAKHPTAQQEGQPDGQQEPLIRVYFRNADSTLGRFDANPEVCKTHKEAILTVKEALVAGGDDLDKKAVLAVIEGGKQ